MIGRSAIRPATALAVVSAFPTATAYAIDPPVEYESAFYDAQPTPAMGAGVM